VAIFSADRLAEVLRFLPSELIGSEGTVFAAVDEVVSGRFGFSVSGIDHWGFFVGYDEDVMAIFGRGTTSGTVTAPVAFRYRGMDVYRYEPTRRREEPLFAVVTPDTFAVGSTEAITGMLDTALGHTHSVAATPWAQALISDRDPSAAVLILANEGVAEEVGEIRAFLEDVSLGGLSWSVSATATRFSLVMGSDSEASLAAAGLNLLLPEVQSNIAAMEEGLRGEMEGVLEEIGMLSLLRLVDQLISEQTSVTASGPVLRLELTGDPAIAWIGLVGLPAALSFQSYTTRARTTEATMNVRRLYDSSVSYYDNDHTNARGDIISAQFPASVPLTPAQIPCGEQVEPSQSHWGAATWESLNFAVSDPHYYSYQYDSSGTRIGATFTASAFGDLDCDGIYSTFVRVGEVVPGNEVRGGAGLYQWNELE
jgi:hypothetical protein